MHIHIFTQANAVCFYNSYIATVTTITNAPLISIVVFFLSLYMFGFKQYTAGIMGKETRDQSGNSGTNAYEIPVELVRILERAGSLP